MVPNYSDLINWRLFFSEWWSGLGCSSKVQIMSYPISLDNLARDFRYSVRSLRKDARFAFIAVFALTLGIAATTVVFSVFYNMLFNAVAAKDAQRLVVPVIQNADRPDDSAQLFISWRDLKYLKEHNRLFEGVVGRRYGRADGARETRRDLRRSLSGVRCSGQAARGDAPER
jgi:hypothetical protein